MKHLKSKKGNRSSWRARHRGDLLPLARTRTSRRPARALARPRSAATRRGPSARPARQAASLYPDTAIGTGSIQTKTYTITNPSAGHQNLTNVTVDQVANADGSAVVIRIVHQRTTSRSAVAAVGATYTDTDSAGQLRRRASVRTDSVTVQMIDNGANQNDCRGLTVPLYFFAQLGKTESPVGRSLRWPPHPFVRWNDRLRPRQSKGEQGT